MKIGIVRESKIPPDRRVPLSPDQCKRIQEIYPPVKIIVQPSPVRCFPDDDYRQAGILVNEHLENCDVMFGIKEVKPKDLIYGKTYFFFSHTIKKQKHNKLLLKQILENQIRLLDYEILTDQKGNRIIGFGRWAGLIGTYNGIRAYGLRNQLPPLPPPQECQGLDHMVREASRYKLPPLRITLTGDGRVARGAAEMLAVFGIQKVTVDSFLTQPGTSQPVYTQISPGDYNRHKQGIPFDLSHFFRHPEDYESNFIRFCDKTDLLVLAAYWDPKAPALITLDQMRSDRFRIRIIADISCDILGPVPSSIRTTTFQDPFYDFNAITATEAELFHDPGNITVMTIDNLPCGLPKESSVDFGNSLISQVIPLLVEGDPHRVLARGTIAQDGKLTENYSYLQDWVEEGESR